MTYHPAIPAKRNRLGHALVSVLVLLALVTVAAQAGIYLSHVQDRMTTLEHACGPVDTGGGVTQCANPSVRDLALTACATNPAYYADGYDPAMVAQCLADWQESR